MKNYLMKSCHAEHLLKVVNQLRLGTLQYFRRHPDPEVGDKGEAALETNIRIDYGVLTTWQMCILTGGAFGFPDVEGPLIRPGGSYIHNLSSQRLPDGRLQVSGVEHTYSTEGSDALIFCMTRVDSEIEPSRVGYNANWKMARADAVEFANLMHQAVMKKLYADPEYFLTKQQIGSAAGADLSVVMKHGPVQYRDRVVDVINPDIIELGATCEVIQNPEMMKAKNYCNQDEYRFCFRIVRGRRILKLKDECCSLSISAEPFRKFAL